MARENLKEAAYGVLGMDQDEIELRAKHDPDLFRDIAAAYVAISDQLRDVDSVVGAYWWEENLSFIGLRVNKLSKTYTAIRRSLERFKLITEPVKG